LPATFGLDSHPRIAMSNEATWITFDSIRILAAFASAQSVLQAGGLEAPAE
jgi:hypothetical protein